MSNNIVPSIVNLPVELIYRILDCFDPVDILTSIRHVCTQLDQIIETYHGYQVNSTIRRRESVRRYPFGIYAEHPQCRLTRTWLERIIFVSHDIQIDMACREERSFLDNHHLESRVQKNRWMESETISWGTEDQSSNTTIYSPWLSRYRSPRSTVSQNTDYAENSNESERDPISCRSIENQQS